ncbi:hypothetical protein A2U01_0074508, partial [Trifolium medium]|nr:hypothetical protein [Trifolium medium]
MTAEVVDAAAGEVMAAE